MDIELKVPNAKSIRLHERTYDPALDDVRSILTDVCEAIEHHGRFTVSGFGQDSWPVDVGTDLVVFLEQLPGVIQSIRSGVPTEIDFYEQGIERTIAFSPAGSDFAASCVSHGAWQPDPGVELVDHVSLEKMLVRILDTFMSLLSCLSPRLAKHEWIRSWLGGSSSRH